MAAARPLTCIGEETAKEAVRQVVCDAVIAFFIVEVMQDMKLLDAVHPTWILAYKRDAGCNGKNS